MVPSAFRTSPVDDSDQLFQFFMGPDGRDGSLFPGFYHGHFCRKVIRHDTFLVQETEKGTQGTDMLLYCFVGKACQCPDISINRIQSDCCEIIHPLCGQVIPLLGISVRKAVAFPSLLPLCRKILRKVYMRQRVAALSNGADLVPHEISMLFAVLPETFCKGLFNQIHKKFIKRQPFFPPSKFTFAPEWDIL